MKVRLVTRIGQRNWNAPIHNIGPCLMVLVGRVGKEWVTKHLLCPKSHLKFKYVLEYSIWSNISLGIFYVCQSLFMLAVYMPCFIVMLSAELQVGVEHFVSVTALIFNCTEHNSPMIKKFFATYKLKLFWSFWLVVIISNYEEAIFAGLVLFVGEGIGF